MEYDIGDLIEIKHTNIDTLVVLDLKSLPQNEWKKIYDWNALRPKTDNFFR